MKNGYKTWAAAGLILVAGTCSAAVVGFEDLAVGPGGNRITGDVVSSAFRFDSSSNHLHQANNAFGGNSGSTFLTVDDYVGPNVLTMTQVGGDAFSLLSVDLGEWGGDFGSLATEVTMIGQLFGGGTVQTTFTLDGNLSDGTTNNFQTFWLGSGWSNLVGVQFDATAGRGASYWGLDNISVGNPSSVPEPATLALVGLSLAGLAASRKRRKT